MLKNFQMKDQEKFIKYNDDYVINLDVSSDDKSFIQGHTSEQDHDVAIGLDLNEAFGASVLKNVQVSNHLKKDLAKYNKLEKNNGKIKGQNIKKKFDYEILNQDRDKS